MWTVMQLVPNTDNVLVGKQRKPRAYLAINHPAATCEDAYTKQAEINDEVGRPGTTRVEFDGGNSFGIAGQPGNAEYVAMVRSRQAARDAASA